MQTTAPTGLWPFNKCPTAVLTATVAITNGHNVVVAVSFETATNPVHISSRISYVFLLCNYGNLSFQESTVAPLTSPDSPLIFTCFMLYRFFHLSSQPLDTLNSGF